MKKQRILPIALVAFAATSLTAQETQVPNTLSLEAAIGFALENNPTYLQAANDRGPQQWAVRNSVSTLFLPSLSANTTLSYSGTGSQRFLIQDFNQPSATIGSNYSLNVNWRFDGATLLAPGVQRSVYDATLAGIDASGMAVRNLVVQQYLGVLEAEEQVVIQLREVNRNEENLRLAQARFDVGQTTVIDLRQAEVAKGRSDVALLQAEQLVLVEKLRLYQTIGVPAPSDPTVISLPDTFTIIEPRWVLEDLLAMAEAENPDVISLDARAASAGRNEAAVKSQWLPSMNVSAGWSGFTQQFTNSDFLVSQAQASSAGAMANCSTNNVIFSSAGLPVQDCAQLAISATDEATIREGNSGFPFSFKQQPFSARITLSLPIFDRFDRNVNISQASAQADDAREQLRARELEVRTEVSRTHFGLIASHQTISIQEANRGAAQEQLRLARERYRVGSGTFFDLLDAQLVAQQAEADYVSALYAYHRALANMEAAVGRTLR